MIKTAATATPAAHFYSTKSPTAVPAPAGVSPIEGRRRWAVIVSSPELDLQRDRVLRGAVDTTRQRPVPALVTHNREGLPCGMVGDFHYLPSGELGATLSLPPQGISQKADEIDGLIRAGIGLEFSLGFDALESLPNQEGGLDFSKITVREVSCVPIGAAIGTRVLSAVKGALRAKDTGYLDPQAGNPSGYGSRRGPDDARGSGDPQRDPCSVATAGTCPKYKNQMCSLGTGCPAGLGGSGTGSAVGGAMKNASIWAKQNIPPLARQMGHRDGSERARGAWAFAHGTLDMKAREKDAQTLARWDAMKNQLLAMAPRDRPVLKAGVDLSRQDLEMMPQDVRSLVLGHTAPDSRLEGLG